MLDGIPTPGHAYDRGVGPDDLRALSHLLRRQRRVSLHGRSRAIEAPHVPARIRGVWRDRFAHALRLSYEHLAQAAAAEA